MATRKYLANIDLNQNELQNPVIQNLASAPSNPKEGQIYYNTADKSFYGYKNGSWFKLDAQGTTYTEGTGIDITGNVISADFDAVATAAQGALADTALQPNDDISELNNDAGYITGISSSDVTTALGYTPYSAANPSGYQANIIEGITVNGTSQTPTNKVISLTIPTQASDIGALPSSTKYAAALDLSINSTTYVITGQLKDQDGNNLGTAQTIDLPLESVVVSGSYDDENKEIILTLQSGSTIEIPVADLIAGLQSEITSSNKLNADLVDDSTSTNKFVTAANKTTWNNKQDALTAGSNINISGGTISAIDTTYSAGSGLSLNSTTFAVDFTDVATAAQGAKADTAAQVYSESNPALTASGGQCTWTVTHNLGSRNVEVKVYEISTWEEVVTSVALTSTSVATVKLNSTSNIAAASYQVVVAGH